MNQIALEKQFECEPEVLWRAWTDPTVIRKWFGSDPNGKVNDVEVSLRIGGGFEVSFENGDGTSFTCFGKYLEMVYPEKLRFSWGWQAEKLDETIELVFEKRGTSTVLGFIITNIAPGGSHNYAEGWTRTFNKLERVIVSI